LEEREKEKRLEEALSHRKRSSRIQIRDLQQQERLRQEALEYAHRQQRRMTTRQEEMAKKKEDEEQAHAVNTREERLKERELRIQQREMEKIKALSRQEEKAAREAAREQERIQKEQEKAQAKAKAKAAKAAETTANPDQLPKPAKKRGPKGPRKKKVMEEEDNWSFDCLCGVKGQNLVCNPANLFQSIIARVFTYRLSDIRMMELQ
jgi:chromosome segregation ATPase